jgi:hypothetical protein
LIYSVSVHDSEPMLHDYEGMISFVPDSWKLSDNAKCCVPDVASFPMSYATPFVSYATPMISLHIPKMSYAKKYRP